jgi:hypothetical protein
LIGAFSISHFRRYEKKKLQPSVDAVKALRLCLCQAEVSSEARRRVSEKIRVLSCNPVDVLRPEILYAIFDTTIPAIDHGEALFIGV